MPLVRDQYIRLITIGSLVVTVITNIVFAAIIGKILHVGAGGSNENCVAPTVYATVGLAYTVYIILQSAVDGVLLFLGDSIFRVLKFRSVMQLVFSYISCLIGIDVISTTSVDCFVSTHNNGLWFAMQLSLSSAAINIGLSLICPFLFICWQANSWQANSWQANSTDTDPENTPLI